MEYTVEKDFVLHRASRISFFVKSVESTVENMKLILKFFITGVWYRAFSTY